MEKKLLSVLAFVAVFAVMVSTFASATSWTENSQPDIDSMRVYVKGELAWEGRCVKSPLPVEQWNCTTGQFYNASLERGETIDVTVVFNSMTNASKVNLHLWSRISGETYEDETGKFDLYPYNTYTRTMYLRLPSNLGSDAQKFYTLHVEIESDETLSGVSKADISFDIQKLADELSIKSVNLRTNCPSGCSTVYVDAVVKNTGNHDLEDVYVKATIKELGITGTQYIDVLVPVRTHDDAQSQEVTIPLSLPANVQPGTYTIEVKAYNDDVESALVSQQFVISGQASSNVEVTTQTTRQDIVQGKTVAYTLIVTNRGATTQSFSLDATGLEGWATTQMNPSTFSLASGESKLVTVYVTSKEDAIVAEHLFTVKVNYGSETKTLNFVANVTEGKTASLDLKTTLMIVGIVLAVAIIILLIVLLAQKSRSDGEKPEESYY